MYCEDRKTFQCYPSYNTIGTAVGMSKNTVKKYVEGLERRGLIYTEPTMVRTKDGRNHNGSLLYTLQPLKPIEDAYFDKLIRIQNSKMIAQAALEKYDNKLKKKGKLN
jgi:DNA-binding transcriptional regulator YhcF (GntR family)